jgi:predicted NBD/HSP70 family sugar kinase
MRLETYARIDKHQMARINRQSVMRCITNHAPINRAAIARMTGLSLPTVMVITDELLQHGMILAEKETRRSMGKRPDVLSVCGEHYRFVGVDIGRTATRIVVVGLDKQPIFTLRFATERFEQASGFVDRLCEAIRDAIEQSQVEVETIVGVCVAMPGLIERQTGNVLFSPNFGWKDVPLQEWMNARLPYQVIVENANRAQGMWEICCNQGDDQLSVLCIGVGYGIGGAFFQNGKLYYGASGTSGEIGHITVSRDNVWCTCGNRGCLEAMASGAALAQQAVSVVLSRAPTLLTEMCQGNAAAIDAKMVFEGMRRGDAVCRELIEKAADYIGLALATTVNIMDPDKIYLCGGLMKNGDEFLKLIREATLRRQMHQAGRNVMILPGSMEEWNVALGATQVIPYYEWNAERLAFMR